jgi:hypothetical protein
MSKAELEIIKMKHDESHAWERAKRTTLGSFGATHLEKEEEEDQTNDNDEYRPISMV